MGFLFAINFERPTIGRETCRAVCSEVEGNELIIPWFITFSTFHAFKVSEELPEAKPLAFTIRPDMLPPF